MFDKILIANRGEIACRIVSTCHRLGVCTVAVYSDADAASRHVRLADEAVRVGPAAARDSYLDVDRILDAASRTGAQAIHPGYGFLSENPDFAAACAHAGRVFIGPSVAAIRAMGSKSAAKALMLEAGVPSIPGYHGANQDLDFLQQHADAIGYPIMIKASAGGGGKGMRRVEESAQFPAALVSCQREASLAFGDSSVLIEKCLLRPRHIEVQVFGDSFGNVLTLFERDCSVQRRHQKVLEEAPAPRIPQKLRDALGHAAVAAARAVNYLGAGTVEFLADKDGRFYFMEMNTRLQVEHPTTEMITGLDLVEWQLRVAAGEALPLAQEQLAIHGHAIEARIYAEDPANEFLPSIGKLVHLKPPQQSTHLRIDTGVEQGDTVTPFYDPMIAKLIVWGETRELALNRMVRALTEYQIVGVMNNIAFLRRLVDTPSFLNADLDTRLIERECARLTLPSAPPPDAAFLFVTLSLLLSEDEAKEGVEDARSPWTSRDGWRLNGSLRRPIIFATEDSECLLTVEYSGNVYRISLESNVYSVNGHVLPDARLLATIDGHQRHATVVDTYPRYTVFLEGECYALSLIDPLAMRVHRQDEDANLLAPMPGLVVTHLVGVGDPVTKGTPLLVLEAMKMEYTIRAPAAGTVRSFLFFPGEQVAEGAELLRFDDKPLNQNITS